MLVTSDWHLVLDGSSMESHSRYESDGCDDGNVGPLQFFGPVDGIFGVMRSLPIHYVWIDLGLICPSLLLLWVSTVMARLDIHLFPQIGARGCPFSVWRWDC